MIENLKLIVCTPDEKSHSNSSDWESHPIQTSIAAIAPGECNHHLLNTSTQFAALANSSQAALAEPLQQAITEMESDTVLDVVLLFPPTAQDSCEAWQKYPTRLVALRENLAQRVAAVVFRVSALQDLGFADVSIPIWDVVIRASQKPGRCQAVQLGEKLLADGTQTSPSFPELAPGRPDHSWDWVKSYLDSVSAADLVSQVTSTPDGIALKAGLLQIHNYLDASHELSQSVQGRGRNSAGDYWHAIMHRREPDYSNAKYWFRNVGSHPLFHSLAESVDSLLSQSDSPTAHTARQKLLSKGEWDPFAFVDFCQECNQGGDLELTLIAQQIQWSEMQLLLDQTYRDATT